MHTYISQHKNSAYQYTIFCFYFIILFYISYACRGEYACHTNTIVLVLVLFYDDQPRGAKAKWPLILYTLRQSTAYQAARLILPLEHQSEEKEAIPACANTASNALWRIYTSRLCHLCRSLHSVYSFTNHYLTVRTVSLLLQLITCY